MQKAHPDELFNLLTRVVPYLRSKSWETRTAAARAVGGIVENAERFDPNADDGFVKTETNGASNGSSNGLKKEESDQAEAMPLSDDQLQLDTLDVSSILKKGKPLLGSAGKEYDYQFANMDAAQRLAAQKQSLTARLGLGGEYMENEIINEKDIAAPHHTVPTTPGIPKIDTQNVPRTISLPTVNTPFTATSPNGHPASTPQDDSHLSKRQLNMLKRKNKKEIKSQASKVRIVDLRRGSTAETPESPAAPMPHPVKTEVKREDSDSNVNDYFSLERQGGDDDTKVVSEFKGAAAPEKSTLQSEAEENGLEWPFERLCEFLTVDLFDHAWEIRHGAAMGLREVIRVHGGGAGRMREKTRAQNDVLNRRWLDDLACRLCCVFMLDRFGDYISDNVVVPIRETAGQTLGAVLQYLPPVSVKSVFRILRRLVMQDDPEERDRPWQACHGGMLGMRYLVAVRSDLLLQEPELLDGVLDAVMKGLGDEDDDVRAVSAATLIPVAKELVDLRPRAIDDLMITVWDCLSNLSDDLSASTGSVMDLLAKLCSFQQVLDAMKRNAQKDSQYDLCKLVPRLYPFLRHTITTVRSAVLRALSTFINLEADGTTESWTNGRALRLIYQNILVERNEGVLKLSLSVWRALIERLASTGASRLENEFESHLSPLVTLTLHPIGVSRHPLPMPAELFVRPSGQTYAPLASQQPARKPSPTAAVEPPPKRRRRMEKKDKDVAAPSSSHNIDGPMMQGDVDLVGMDVMVRSKIFAAQALGQVIAAWPETSRMQAFDSIIRSALNSTHSTTQLTAAMVIQEYATAMSDRSASDALARSYTGAVLHIIENERPPCYSDLTSFLQVVRAQCHSLTNAFRDHGHIAPSNLPQIPALVQGEENASRYAFSITDAEKIVGPDYDRLYKALTPASRIASQDLLKAARSDAMTVIDEAKVVKEQRDVRIFASAAAGLVALGEIPKRPAAVIKSLMDSIKKEENIELQKRSAAAVGDLVARLTNANKRVVAEKIVTNLVKFCCMETAETPEFHINATTEIGILSLKKEEDIRDHPDAATFEREAKAARTTRRGAKEALEQLVSMFGGQLFEKIPKLHALMEGPIRRTFEGEELPADILDPNNESGQEVVDALSTLRALVPKFHPDLHPFVQTLLPLVANALQCKLSVLRYAAAKCFATICSVMTVQGVTMLVEKVIPAISNPVNVHCRQGAIECIYHLIHVMEDGILPYVIFLIVPVLGRMSDSDNDIRLIATTTFATLVKLVPLEAGIPDPPGLSEDLLKGRDRERKFIAQMLDVKKVEPFKIPVAIKAELRSYQQDGVNWLAFLNRYNLHGILCDDMGLGKTLQTLCIVASDHHQRAEEFTKTGAEDVRPMPSLIVCPPTLSGHWQQEIRTYAPFLTSVAYVGPPAERAKYRAQLNTADVVITSYDICRNDIEILSPLNWNYCVLDEGHLIKNPKAKTTLAVKRFASNHRLILSGTPIQNNVLELWSLFDFLMPGFLGTEKVFQDRFAKPIAASRFSKSSSKEQEAGALAIEALHKQVLPFLLRRLKEEVLNDLPPKILQNYYCDLSDLQRRLFEDFTKKEAKTIAESAATNDKESKQHIFQALQYMRKLCNSPALVLKENHKQYNAIQQYLARSGSSLRDIQHAPKLNALRDLLVDCGIGVESTAAGDVPAASDAVSQHRALIFCQMKEMLDMVQTDVLQKLLPSVQYMRLDGSVEASKRQEIVNKFNSDPSYDVLLLTTSVGGLGLNLTGADTVIFVEHDWNPQKDMQAMDRAHRIGQKKVVNVYRIVTRGTLEEKILK